MIYRIRLDNSFYRMDQPCRWASIINAFSSKMSFTFVSFELSSIVGILLPILSNLLELPDNEFSTERRSVEVKRVFVEVGPNED